MCQAIVWARDEQIKEESLLATDRAFAVHSGVRNNDKTGGSSPAKEGLACPTKKSGLYP